MTFYLVMIGLAANICLIFYVGRRRETKMNHIFNIAIPAAIIIVLLGYLVVRGMHP